MAGRKSQNPESLVREIRRKTRRFQGRQGHRGLGAFPPRQQYDNNEWYICGVF